MEKRSHLVFSIVMSAFMISIMSLVVTYLNIGWSEQTIDKWLSSFVVAWAFGFPLIFIFAPIFKKAINKYLTSNR